MHVIYVRSDIIGAVARHNQITPTNQSRLKARDRPGNRDSLPALFNAERDGYPMVRSMREWRSRIRVGSRHEGCQ